MGAIEPRFEPKYTLLIQELDEYLEVIFFTSGVYKVGYTLNGRPQYVIPYKSTDKGHAIGHYGATFHKRAKFIYKTVNDCHG